MFSRPLMLSAVVASASAVSFLPFQGLSQKAGSYLAEDKLNYSKATGIAYSKLAPCQTCIRGGFEFVATTKAEYIPTAGTALAGVCCVPGIYTASSCDITSLAATMQSSSAWKQAEVALANCPNPTATCGTSPQSFELSLTPTVVTVGTASSKLTVNDSCSYIASSKCLAPTVDIGTIVSKDSVGEMFQVAYLEYSMVSVDAAITPFTLQITSADSLVSKTDMLGGDLFPVTWKKAGDIVSTVPAEFFADWMSVYTGKYNAYTTAVGDAYLAKVDQYNFFAAGKAWTKAWLAKNIGKTIDETTFKPYTDILRKVTVGGADIFIAPEIPQVPILPAAYTGPSLFSGTTVQTADTFMISAGMGKPVIGMLKTSGSAGGLGHSFGVKGQGNELKDLNTSDTTKSLIYPAQATEEAGCKTSYLYVIVQGTDAQTKDGSTIQLNFAAQAWSKNPLVIDARPTATTVMPLPRESAKFLAAGIATVAMVAASLY